jgi:hypothetical protein
MNRLLITTSLLLISVSAWAFDFPGSVSWLYENRVVILTALLAISEVLALVPSIKSNSIFQMIVNAIKYVIEKFSPSAK